MHLHLLVYVIRSCLLNIMLIKYSIGVGTEKTFTKQRASGDTSQRQREMSELENSLIFSSFILVRWIQGKEFQEKATPHISLLVGVASRKERGIAQDVFFVHTILDVLCCSCFLLWEVYLDVHVYRCVLSINMSNSKQ